MQSQQGDVKLYQTDDGGDIAVEGGIVEMDGGLATMAYLCLFGGNEDDDGIRDNPLTWWGNVGESDPDKQYRSETQYLLQSIPATTANLRRIEDAAARDLAALKRSGAAASVGVSVTMPGLNRVSIEANINGDTALKFEANWRSDI